MSFPIEPQEESNWCWAAVSDSADHYFDSASTLTQCTIASKALTQNCCADPDSCNEVMKLQNILGPMGRLANVMSDWLPFLELKRELDADRPVAVRIGWFGGGAHFVLITGYKLTRSGVRMIEIADPFFGDIVNGKYVGIWEIDFDVFPEAYQDGGDWTATYLLQGKPGDKP
jgi:Papain-like cysteine protease AvrRpt2